MRSKLIKAVMLTAAVVVAALAAYFGPRWFGAKPPEPATAAAPPVAEPANPAAPAPSATAPAGAATPASPQTATAPPALASAPPPAAQSGPSPTTGPARTQPTASPTPAASTPAAATPAASTPAAATPAAALAPPPIAGAPIAPAPPAFDVVRVEPSGEAVIAGRAAPDAVVRLKAGDTVVAEGRADAAGQFVLLPPPLAAGEHLLTLDTGAGAAPGLSSTQSVSVRVPAKGQGEVVVAIVEPNQPTRLLSDQRKEATAKGQPSAPAAAQPQATPAPVPAAGGAPARPVVVRTVEAEEGGAFYATGSAAPGAKVRIYLNDAFLAEAPVSADGKWSMRVEKGMQPGAYRVRADQTEAAGPKVVARAEVAFNYPAPAAPSKVAAAPPQAAPGRPAVAPAPAAPAVASAPPAPSAPTPAGGPPAKVAAAQPSASDAPVQPAAGAPAAGVTVPEVRTANVTRGDSLWRISRKIYGSGLRYTEIFEANPAQIRDPDLIYPGQILVVPKQN